MIAKKTEQGSRDLIRRGLAAGAGALAVTALVAGCTSASAEGDGSIQMIIPTRDTNAFFATVSCEVEAGAADNGLSISMIDVKQEDYSVQGYTAAIMQAQAKNPDAIITGVPDATAMDSTLQDIKDNGKKLITYDAVIDDDSITDAQVATDVYGTGVVAAEKMNELTGGTGKILVVDFIAGNPTTNARARGFMEEAAKSYPGLEVLPIQYDEATPSKSAQIIDATLARYPDLAGIWFSYNQAAINALPSVSAATAPGQVKVVAADADPAQVEYLRDGYIQALLAQDAPKVVDAILSRTKDAIDGNAIDPVTLRVPPVVITPENIEDPATAGALYRTSC